MTPGTTHPLVSAYLEELEGLLGGIDPRERSDVMLGVREHLDGALGSAAAGDQEVREALAELGPPQLVADETYAGRPPTTGVQTGNAPVMARTWVPVVVAILTAVAVLLTILVVSTMGGTVSSSSSSSGDVNGVAAQVQTREELTGSPLIASLVALLVTLPLWTTVAVLVGISPLWVRREKLVAVLLIPGAALLMGLLPQVGWWLIGAKGVYGGAWTALILVLLGGGTILARSTRKAAARGHRPESSARAARQD